MSEDVGSGRLDQPLSVVERKAKQAISEGANPHAKAASPLYWIRAEKKWNGGHGRDYVDLERSLHTAREQ